MEVDSTDRQTNPELDFFLKVKVRVGLSGSYGMSMLNQRPNDFRTKLCYLVDIIIVYVSYTHVNKLYFKINLIVVSMLPATGRAYTILHQTKARDN